MVINPEIPSYFWYFSRKASLSFLSLSLFFPLLFLQLPSFPCSFDSQWLFGCLTFPLLSIYRPAAQRLKDRDHCKAGVQVFTQEGKDNSVRANFLIFFYPCPGPHYALLISCCTCRLWLSIQVFSLNNVSNHQFCSSGLGAVYVSICKKRFSARREKKEEKG